MCTFVKLKNHGCDMSDKQELKSLLGNMQKGLERCTVQELNNALVTAIEKKNDSREEIDSVLDLVCKQFEVTKKQLLESNARGIVKEAQKTAHCLLHFNLQLSFKYIGSKIFFKSREAIYVAIKYYRSIDENTKVKADREFRERYLKLEQQYLQLKKKSDGN